MTKMLVSLALLFALLGANPPAPAPAGFGFGEIDQLKDCLKSHFESFPKLQIHQKAALAGLFRYHRPALREEAEKLRGQLIGMRREFRLQLTQEQLLRVLDLQDEFAMRPPAAKASILLKKLDPAERAELLGLFRDLARGGKSEMSANLDRLFAFFQEKVQPRIAAELDLSPAQQIELDRIVREGRPKANESVRNLLERLFSIRSLAREILTSEQQAHIDASREAIWEAVLEFARNL